MTLTLLARVCVMNLFLSNIKLLLLLLIIATIAGYYHSKLKQKNTQMKNHTTNMLFGWIKGTAWGFRHCCIICLTILVAVTIGHVVGFVALVLRTYL